MSIILVVCSLLFFLNQFEKPCPSQFSLYWILFDYIISCFRVVSWFSLILRKRSRYFNVVFKKTLIWLLLIPPASPCCMPVLHLWRSTSHLFQSLTLCFLLLLNLCTYCFFLPKTIFFTPSFSFQSLSLFGQVLLFFSVPNLGSLQETCDAFSMWFFKLKF